MAEYINIRGQSIEVVTSDPANPTVGQIWYNSTSNTLKGGGVTTVGAWATGNNMNTARNLASANSATQTTALGFAGYRSPAILYTATEEYNGTNWTTVNPMSLARFQLAGAGTQTAALAFGGTPPNTNATEEYDGTSWTAGGPLSTAKRLLGGAGTLTAGLAFGGAVSPLVLQTVTEEYNGSTWAISPGSLNTARRNLGGGGVGTQTAALCIGGQDAPGYTGATEEYDGTSWTISGSLNTARRDLASAGIQTLALAFGGENGSYLTTTEQYDGSTWTNNPTGLNTARGTSGGAGNTASALTFGGDSPSPPQTAATEEWTGAGSPLTVTITAS